jgi:hypothetical protein
MEHFGTTDDWDAQNQCDFGKALELSAIKEKKKHSLKTFLFSVFIILVLGIGPFYMEPLAPPTPPDDPILIEKSWSHLLIILGVIVLIYRVSVYSLAQKKMNEMELREYLPVDPSTHS